MGIDKINEDKSVNYLMTRFKSSDIFIDQKTALHILHTVANIPYYIQFIAYEIWQSIIIADRNKVTINDIDEAIESILMLKSDYYWELTNKQTAYRKKVLYAISSSAVEIFSKQTALKYNLGAASSTQKALEVTIENGIIEHTRGKYEFSDPIYSIFINRFL